MAETTMQALATKEPTELTDEELEREKREAETAVAVTRAVGEQLQLLVTTPGVGEVLMGFGKFLGMKGELELEREKQAHELRMAQESNRAEAQRRAGWLGLLAASIAGVFLLLGGGSLVWAVHAEYLTANNALTTGLVLTTILGAMGWKRTPQQGAPPAAK